MNGSTLILIVEDDLFLRQAFRLMLEDAGYTVREAGTAEETMASVAEQKPDLILLDLGLPDRSGLEVARELKADSRTADIVIIALTGSVGAAEKRACLAVGCKAYFAKPMSPRLLLTKLPELLEH
ncbi:MAG TPA: response regulator [Longimicrobiales bacterium]|nr:response regulator [Longimicrobiales bacterium]